MVLMQDRDIVFHRKVDEASRLKSEKFRKYFAEKQASKYGPDRRTAPNDIAEYSTYDSCNKTTRFHTAPAAPTGREEIPASTSSHHRNSTPRSTRSVSPYRQQHSSGFSDSTRDQSRTIHDDLIIREYKKKTKSDRLCHSKSQQQGQHHHEEARSQDSRRTGKTTSVSTSQQVVSISHKDRAAYLSKLAAATAKTGGTKKNTNNSSFTSDGDVDVYSTRDHEESDISYDRESRNPSNDVEIHDNFMSDERILSTSQRDNSVSATYMSSDADSSKRALSRHRNRNGSNRPQQRPLSISQRVAKASRYAAVKEARRNSDAAAAESIDVPTYENHATFAKQEAHNKKGRLRRNHPVIMPENRGGHAMLAAHRALSPKYRREKEYGETYHKNNNDQEILSSSTDKDKLASDRVAVLLDHYRSYTSDRPKVEKDHHRGSYPPSSFTEQFEQNRYYPSDRAIVAFENHHRPRSPHRAASMTNPITTPSHHQETMHSSNSPTGAGWKTVPPFVKKISDIFMGNNDVASHDDADVPPVTSIEIGPIASSHSFESHLH